MLSPGDVLPDVQLGPVGQREDPDVLALVDPAVVEAPQLGALVLRVPLAELVAEGEHPLLGPGLLLVAAGAAEQRVEAVLLGGLQQHRRLDPVARAVRAPRRTRPRSIASWTDATISCRPSSSTRWSRNSSTSGKLWPVSTCSTGNGIAAGQNAFSASRSMTMESLPPENSSTGRSHLRDHLADDVDRLRLQRAQLAQAVVAARSPQGRVGRRHSGPPIGPSRRPAGPAPARSSSSTRSASSGRQTSEVRQEHVGLVVQQR